MAAIRVDDAAGSAYRLDYSPGLEPDVTAIEAALHMVESLGWVRVKDASGRTVFLSSSHIVRILEVPE